MSIHKIIAGPWGCGDLDALATFLGAAPDTNTGGRNRYHCSYVIYTDGDYFYAENGTTGKLDYGGPSNEPGGTVSGTNAAAVIQATITATGAGKIYIKEGTYPLGVTPLTINVTLGNIEIGGLGDATIITYAGAGYAIRVTGALPGYQYIRLFDFKLDGVTKTAARSGIHFAQIAPRTLMENVYVTNFDIGLYVQNTNSLIIRDCVFDVCNTGILTLEGVDTQISPFRIEDCRFVLCTNYGIRLDGVGVQTHIYGASISNCGQGISVGDIRVIVLNIKNCYFEYSTTLDIQLHGQNNTFPIHSAVIDNCYFNGGTTATHAISVSYVEKVEMRSIYSWNHTAATINLNNVVPNNVLLILPYTGIPTGTPDPFLLDGTLTMLNTRLGGMVIEERRMGVIANCGTAGGVIEGDVVEFDAADGNVYTVAVANNDVVKPVMYGQAQSKPVVVAIKGITPVKMAAAGAVTYQDTIVSNNAVTEGLVNNAQTDPKKIIGYALETKGAAAPGTPLVLIL